MTDLSSFRGREGFVDDPGVLQLAPPLACIKVHGLGLEWWADQGMPGTWTIVCTAASNAVGIHVVYELADDFDLPLASIQDYEVDTVTRFFTRVPPETTKHWMARQRPTLLDRLPSIPARWLGTHTPWMAVYETRYDGGPKKQ